MSHTHQVDHYEIGSGDRFEIGYPPIDSGPSIDESGYPEGIDEDVEPPNRMEIGGPSIEEDGFPEDISVGEAVREIIKTASANRQPPPKMRAVSVDMPIRDDAVSAWFTDVAIGCGHMIGVANPFPLMTKLLTRFGAGMEKPRYVRVDTEQSYPGFCAAQSPEMAEMQERIAELAEKVDEHIHDPYAHTDLLDEIDDVEEIGADVVEGEKSKEIEMWLPEFARGKVRAWREGDFICASICLPGSDGELRICTSMTPVVNAIEEMESHAQAANVPAQVSVGLVEAMGCVLGAGTLVKEMAAGAPSILQRPEASKCEPFVCRIEPKASPAICAFAALLCECKQGNQQACVEWDSLVDAASRAAPYVAQAMREAKDIFLKMKV